MTKKVPFLDMFPDYRPPEEWQKLLSQAVLAGADIDPATRRIEVDMASQLYIPRSVLDGAQRELMGLYGLNGLTLNCTFPPACLQEILPEEVRDLFVSHNSMARGVLAGAQYAVEGQTITLRLAANGKETLEKVLPQVKGTLQARFGTPVEIAIETGAVLEGKELQGAMEKMRREIMSDIPAPVFREKEKPEPKPDAIFGKPFKGDATPMDSLDLDMGSVIVEGKVFSVDHRELKKEMLGSFPLI